MNDFLKELKYLNEVFSNYEIDDSNSFLIIRRNKKRLADVFIMYRNLEKEGLTIEYFSDFWTSFNGRMVNKSDFELYISLKNFLDKTELNEKLNQELSDKPKKKISKV